MKRQRREPCVHASAKQVVGDCTPATTGDPTASTKISEWGYLPRHERVAIRGPLIPYVRPSANNSRLLPDGRVRGTAVDAVHSGRAACGQAQQRCVTHLLDGVLLEAGALITHGLQSQGQLDLACTGTGDAAAVLAQKLRDVDGVVDGALHVIEDLPCRTAQHDGGDAGVLVQGLGEHGDAGAAKLLDADRHARAELVRSRGAEARQGGGVHCAAQTAELEL